MIKNITDTIGIIMWNLYCINSHANHYVFVVVVVLLSSSLWNSDAFMGIDFHPIIPPSCNHDNHYFFKSRCSRQNPYSLKRTIIYESLENEIKEDLMSSTLINSKRNENDDIHNNIPENEQSIGIELWLDLRDTAILPSAALSHLLETLDDETLINDDDKVFFIDKVLTSTTTITTTNEGNNNEKSFVEWVTQHMEQQFENLIEIIYETKKEESSTNLIFSATAATVAKDTSFGMRVDLFQDDKLHLTDPIPALQCVSQGEWVVIQPNDNDDEQQQQRKIAVDSLVELLVASTSSLSSLLLNDDNPKEATNNVGMGGVAIVCQNKSDIVHAGAIIQSLLGNGNRVTCTESGIFIPSSDNDQSPPTLLKFAIVLPMDVMLWKTAFFVFGKTEEEEDNKSTVL